MISKQYKDYIKKKKNLLSDKTEVREPGDKRNHHKRKKIMIDNPIHKNTREGWKIFFKEREEKLKIQNQLSELDSRCLKTMDGYCSNLRTTDKWFKHKDWNNITEKDIQKVYSGLQTGKILNRYGKPYANTRAYYTKIFRGEPFEIFGKDKLARKVIKYLVKKDPPVKYISVEDWKKIHVMATEPNHKALLWAAWDIGENVNSLVRLKKRDCKRKIGEDNEPYYDIHLYKEILKKNRVARTEMTMFPKTAMFLDMILENKKDDDLAFGINYIQATNIYKKIMKQTGIKCTPGNEKSTLKDLRSGCAMRLLDAGWTIEQINMRLGHHPTSRELERYVTYSTTSRNKPIQQTTASNQLNMQKELEKAQEMNRVAKIQSLNRADEKKNMVRMMKLMMKEMYKSKGLSEEDSEKFVEHMLQPADPNKEYEVLSEKDMLKSAGINPSKIKTRLATKTEVGIAARKVKSKLKELN